MIWSRDNYYLLCYDDKHEGASRYRIDKMEDVRVEEEPRVEKEEFKGFDPDAYRKQVFSMFGGRLEKVTIRFDPELLGDIYDKFGTDLRIQKTADGMFRTTFEIQVSKTFFVWVVGTLGKVKIVEPANVKKKTIEIGQSFRGLLFRLRKIFPSASYSGHIYIVIRFRLCYTLTRT